MARTTKAALSKAIGRNLTMWRAVRGVGLNELAGMANFDRGNLSKVEAGKVTPSIESLGNLAAALKIPAFYLLIDPSEASR